jgi:hypothetical protein
MFGVGGPRIQFDTVDRHWANIATADRLSRDGGSVSFVLAIVFSAAGVVRCLIDDWELRRSLAPSRTRAANGARVAAALILIFGDTWLASMPHRPLAVVGIVAAIAIVLLAIPMRWLRRVGGGDALQVHRLYMASKRLATDGPEVPSPENVETLRRFRHLISDMATRRLSEWVALITTEIDDWTVSRYEIVRSATRAIRIHELDVAILGDHSPSAERSVAEATFLWRALRAFARLDDLGSSAEGKADRIEFLELLEELERYRRPDTARFIALVRAAADAWLAGGAGQPWTDDSGITGLGREVDDEYWRIWPNLRILWGADLDDEDREELSRIVSLRAPDSDAADSADTAGLDRRHH